MNVKFRASFEKDIKKIANEKIRERITIIIAEMEKAKSILEVSSVKKLKGGDNFYRVKIADFRIGLVLEKGTVEFVRCLHRKEIYRFFP
jgi:mRNA interferase RelE/StbE